MDTIFAVTFGLLGLGIGLMVFAGYLYTGYYAGQQLRLRRQELTTFTVISLWSFGLLYMSIPFLMGRFSDSRKGEWK